YPTGLSGLRVLLIASSVIIILGLVDDAKDLRPFVKIIVETIVILGLLFFGFYTRIAFLPVWVNMLITFLWMLFITNAFNLLDIVDGLASGLVVIISLTLLTISIVNKDVVAGVILIAMIGAHLGFLKYNYPPAKLYMGDTGSLFSGFILGVTAINISYASPERSLALVTPVLAMSLAIYDTLFLIIMRVRQGKPIFSKTNDHFTLRLLTMGYSMRKSLWGMYCFSIFLAICSLVLAFSSNIVGAVVLLIVILIFIFMGKKVGYRTL
ncbi:MAG: MraY family glycosyltransferase, partial [Candidatus Omnitrophota bacterium]|nr:MraY family glycosyltransferase [Candidatus Omnitrophota bacterium]